MSESQAKWQTWFGDIPPLGWVLRDLCHDRWVRFHALPGSKRCAETAEEDQIVLSRANILAGHILHEKTECVLIFTAWRDSPSREWNPDWTWREDDQTDPTDVYEASFSGIQLKWRPQLCDAVFQQVADDERSAILFNPSTGEVLAPYDGGFDVICRDNLSAQRLKQIFASWLSPREDGL